MLGEKVITVNPNGTSQECSNCGHKVKKAAIPKNAQLPGMPYKFVQGFERGYKHKGAWDSRPQSSINVLIEESLRSPHSLEGECVEYVTIQSLDCMGSRVKFSALIKTTPLKETISKVTARMFNCFGIILKPSMLSHLRKILNLGNVFCGRLL